MKLEYAEEEALLPHYEKHLQYTTPARLPEYVAMLMRFAEVHNPKIALDAGCGSGFLGKYLSDCGVKVVGFDACLARVERARQRDTKGSYFVADIYKAFEYSIMQHFDLIFVVEVLEHLQNPVRVIEAARKLGPVVGTVPENMPYRAHLQVYENVDAVKERLKPDRMGKSVGPHFICYWGPG